MIKCPKCELNYMNDNDTMCNVCKKEAEQKLFKENSKVDNNKEEVEKYLIPYLKAIAPENLELFTGKEESYKLFKLRLPLLVKCSHIDKEHCKKEVIVDSSNTYRYYIEPYFINGTYYHICSQWADSGTEISKVILKLVKNVNLNK